MKYENVSIKKAVQLIDEKKLLLPHIQRPFVWKQDKNHNQVKRFFDSILRDYPFGTFLFWRTQDQIQVRTFILNYRDDIDVWDTYLTSSEYKDNEKLLVLDGQQRLQALYIALKGTYGGKELYFDILSGSDVFWDLHDELKYNFEYLTASEARQRSTDKSYWVLLKKIVMSDEAWTEIKYQILNDMQEAGIDADRALERKVDENGAKAVNLFATQDLIYHYTIDGTTGKPIKYDEILEIFIRANSGGTLLSKSDLMFSLIKLNWDNAEEEFDKLLNEINKQNAFYFDKDFILKTALVLIDKRAKFEVEKFKGTRGEENLAAIKLKWDKIVQSFGWLSDFLHYAQITSDETLPSYNALIPLIYYAYINDNKLRSTKLKNNIQTWLYGALLNGNFSGQSDGIIDTCTDVIKEHSNAEYFPFKELESELRRKYNRVVGVNANVIDSDKHLILNLIYLHNKLVTNFQPMLVSNTPEIDHIFPKSRMLKTYKYSSSIVNNIGNYMLLEKSLNIDKTNILPERYFLEAVKQQPDFYERHLIPADPLLHQPEHFEEFVEARRELILDTIKQVLVYVDDDGNPIQLDYGDQDMDETNAEANSNTALKAEREQFFDDIHAREAERDFFLPYNLELAWQEGFRFYYWIYPDKWAVKFYMQNDDKAKNKEIFDHLYAAKDEIEKRFGSELGWYRQDNKRVSRIEYIVKGEGLHADASRRLAIQDAMIDKLSDLVVSIHPHILVFTEPLRHTFLEKFTDWQPDAASMQEALTVFRASGLTIGHDVVDNEALVWLDIDTGDKADKELFDELCSKKEDIEGELGDKLDWHRYDNLPCSQVWYKLAPATTLEDESKWPALQDQIIQAEEQFFGAIRPHLKQYEIS